MEQNERALSTKAVTYINVDIAVDGNFTLSLSGSPLLKTAITKNVKNVRDPHGGNVYDRMLQADKDNNFKYGSLGSGSDYASFYQFVGEFSFEQIQLFWSVFQFLRYAVTAVKLSACLLAPAS